MKVKKGLKDAESVAAMEIVAFEDRNDAMSDVVKGAREKAVHFLAEMAGKIKTTNFTKAQSEFFGLVMLKQAKEAKDYREKLDMTWEQFCESVGANRRTVDDQLQDLKPFKAEFLASFASFSGFDLNKIRYLGEAVNAKSAKIAGNMLVYDGREIAITPENKDEIQEVLENIESAYKKQIENATEDVKAAKKVIKTDQDTINKMAKDLRKFEKRAEGRGLSPEEDAFEQQIENFKIGFDGYMTRIEPTRIEELSSYDQRDETTGARVDTTVTPRMRASYLEVLGYMRRQINAAYDTATEMYGADMAAPGEAWQPGEKE